MHSHGLTFKEIGRQDNIGSWVRIFAYPSGLITTKEQYDYIIEYPLDFYGYGYNKPTFEECVGKYLDLIDCFGGGADYFILYDPDKVVEQKPWSWGDYGKIDFSCKKCKYKERFWNETPCNECCGCDKFEERIE